MIARRNGRQSPILRALSGQFFHNSPDSRAESFIRNRSCLSASLPGARAGLALVTSFAFRILYLTDKPCLLLAAQVPASPPFQKRMCGQDGTTVSFKNSGL